MQTLPPHHSGNVLVDSAKQGRSNAEGVLPGFAAKGTHRPQVLSKAPTNAAPHACAYLLAAADCGNMSFCRAAEQKLPQLH